ncbi:hypothetical protein SJI19_16740 [Acerihabitans sp. TG2]|uniref:hypothetical protein n=1 Tax=Acerihabitans sp. TG2 TaxID=3096008 RepID=UPI002B222490|nr:hypothetical protein [Acerihabitans sp. TG2]MEA9392173.1 hypothetical protein [Acerihabitans sp. TG2]
MTMRIPAQAINALKALKEYSDLTVKIILSPVLRPSLIGDIDIAKTRIYNNRQWVKSIIALAQSEDSNIHAIDNHWLANKLTQSARAAKRHSPTQIPTSQILRPHNSVRIEAMIKVSDTVQVEHSSISIIHPDAINALAGFCLLNFEPIQGFQPLLDADGAQVISCSLSAADFVKFVASSAQMISESGVTEFLYNAQKLGDQLASFDINFPY